MCYNCLWRHLLQEVCKYTAQFISQKIFLATAKTVFLTDGNYRHTTVHTEFISRNTFLQPDKEMNPLGWFLLSMTPATAINFLRKSLHCQLSFELKNIISSFDHSNLIIRMNDIIQSNCFVDDSNTEIVVFAFWGEGRDFQSETNQLCKENGGSYLFSQKKEGGLGKR